jgi:hypothetical protein
VLNLSQGLRIYVLLLPPTRPQQIAHSGFDFSTVQPFPSKARRTSSKMHLQAILLAVLSWCCSITALTFGTGFNGTVPSIPGLTDFPDSKALDHIEFGFADGVVSTAAHQPWPLIKGWKRSHYQIRYCFADQASKDALRCSLTDAFALWATALGGATGPATGYNLHFVQAFAQGEIQFCYTEGTYNAKTAQGTWNWKLHDRQDSLVVAYRPVDEHGNKPATSASLGYTPDSALFPWQSPQARHYMQISDAKDVPRISHELGHGERYSLLIIFLLTFRSLWARA